MDTTHKAAFNTVIRQFFVICFLVLSFLTACTATNTPTPDIPQSTPEEALASIIVAEERQDFEVVEQLIDPDCNNCDGYVEGLQDMQSSGLEFEISDVQISLRRKQGAYAIVGANYTVRWIVNGNVELERDEGELRCVVKIGEKWYITNIYGQPPLGPTICPDF